MLRNRAFLDILHRTPCRARALPRSPLSTRLITRRPQLTQNAVSPTSLSTTPRANLATWSSRWRTAVSRQNRNIRWNSDKPTPPVTPENGNQAPQSYSQRFKELSRRYGYAAVGVYLGLSVLDFPFCFLTVRLVGPERVGEVEHAIVDSFWSLVAIVVPSMGPEDRTQNEIAVEAEARETQPTAMDSHKHGETASIWTQLLLAYAIHKSLLVFRVPLTAAVTPKVVKTLRSWGWNIGRPAKKVKSAS